MRKITSRERVLRAIEHKEADRVPINFGGTYDTSIVESSPNGRIYTKLCQHLGFYDRPEPVISEALNVVTNIDERVQKKFGSDMRAIGPSIRPPIINKDGTKTWEVFCGLRIKRVGYYDEYFDFPMRDMTSIKDIKNYPFWPNPKDSFITKGKREEAKRLHEETDYAIVACSFFSCMPLNFYFTLTGMERFFTDMKLNPKFYFALCDKLLELGSEMNARFFQQVGDYIDIALIYDDVGGQGGLLMSYQDYKKFYYPYTQKVIENIKKYTNAKILYHCDGSIYDVIKDFIELGVDILHPAQPGTKNMEPGRLKKEFGKDITFCTGIDIQKTLPFETPDGVKKAVKKMIDVYGPGGGFIISPTHNIEPDTPVNNIIAAYEAAQEYSKYPIIK